LALFDIEIPWGLIAWGLIPGRLVGAVTAASKGQQRNTAKATERISGAECPDQPAAGNN
jgi:hypothetical protein